MGKMEGIRGALTLKEHCVRGALRLMITAFEERFAQGRSQKPLISASDGIDEAMQFAFNDFRSFPDFNGVSI